MQTSRFCAKKVNSRDETLLDSVLSFFSGRNFFFQCYHRKFLKFFLQNAILVVDYINIVQNSSLATIRIDHFNEAKKDSLFFLLIQNFVTFNDLRIFLSVRISTNKKSPDYSIEFLKTVVDVKKLFKGAHANPFLRGWTESLLKAVDFELKFPILPV